MNIKKELIRALEGVVEKMEDQKPIRSVKMTKAVKDAYIAQNKELEKMKEEEKELKRAHDALKKRAKTAHEKFWAVVSVDMDMTGGNLRVNEDTFEIEVLEDEDED